MKLVSLSLVLALSAAACGKSDSESKSGAAKSAEGASAASETVTLTQVGLKANLPAGANVSDGIGGDGVMIQAADVVVSIVATNDLTTVTLAEAREDADMYSPQNLADEALPDGWVLTFDNKGGMGANYFLKVYREIGGKGYLCDTTASKTSQRDRALAICKSLAP